MELELDEWLDGDGWQKPDKMDMYTNEANSKNDSMHYSTFCYIL